MDNVLLHQMVENLQFERVFPVKGVHYSEGNRPILGGEIDPCLVFWVKDHFDIHWPAHACSNQQAVVDFSHEEHPNPYLSLGK